jgi:hypothetical protein
MIFFESSTGALPFMHLIATNLGQLILGTILFCACSVDASDCKLPIEVFELPTGHPPARQLGKAAGESLEAFVSRVVCK